MESTLVINDPPEGNLYKTEGPALLIEWEIENYKSMLQAKKIGAVAVSPTFSMRNATWKLQISHLRSSDGQKLVIVYLYKHRSEARYHSITYMIALQINGKDICGGYKKTFVFRKREDEAFCNIVMTERKLLEHMPSDGLTVLCTVYPEAEEQISETYPKEIAMSRSHSSFSDEGIDILASQMKELFVNRENSDFVMKVKGREFQVHKAILSARSPVLSAMLQHDMAEKNSSMTEIVDCEPDVFEVFLMYLYSGRVDELSWDNVMSLYALGDKYDLRHLRKLCIEFMENNLCVEVFCDAFALAAKYHELSLLECAEEFFLGNVKSILVTNDWQLLMKENPVICNELFLKCYD